MIFLFLTNLLSKETNLTDLFKIIETDKIITPELKTYFKCINSDKMEGVYNIASKVEENVFNKLIYVHNAYYPHTIVRETKELCDLLLPLAKKVSEDYRENRFNFKGKIILSDTKEALEVMNNSDTIIKLALSGEKKGVRIFLNFLEKGIFKVNNHLETLEKLGKMGFALAYGILGEVYLAGHFVKKDYKKAKEYFSLGAKKNEPLSLHGLGMVYFYYEKNINSAKDCFIKAIHKGSVAASYSFYLCNEDVTVSNIIGLSYLSSSASKGYIPAMYKQAELNYNSKRYMDALSYLISICKYSDEIREFTSKAEEYFFKGNLIKSLVYYLVLAETGSYSAIENAVFLIKEKKVIKNDDLLFYLLTKSLKNGVFSYLVEIGDCYFYGKGTSVNYSKAFSYYLSAALNGSFKGIISLSYMYFKGLGCKKNIFKAVKYVWKGMEYESFGYIFVIYFIPFYIFIFLLENIPVKDILLSSFFTVLFILFNRIILSVKGKI